jgi:hypothetical protein
MARSEVVKKMWQIIKERDLLVGLTVTEDHGIL